MLKLLWDGEIRAKVLRPNEQHGSHSSGNGGGKKLLGGVTELVSSRKRLFVFAHGKALIPQPGSSLISTLVRESKFTGSSSITNGKVNYAEISLAAGFV
jgi:hypothetical protein